MNKLIACLFLLSFNFQHTANLDEIAWIHGAEDCSKSNDPAIQVVRYNTNTWILRQNRCVNYEAPFMFLFIGTKTALLMDTGATPEAEAFPIEQTVNALIVDWEKEHQTSLNRIIAHTHGHGDHWAGDNQFKGKPQTTIAGLDLKAVTQFFGFSHWPESPAVLDLGNRALDVIPIPGHDDTSIALYDRETRLLLTGDTFYPGRLYVRDWSAFKQSIHRVTAFAEKHPVHYILGNHIEMSTTASVDYPTGTTWQPNEHRLPLTVHDLKILDQALSQAGDKPERLVFDGFIVEPK